MSERLSLLRARPKYSVRGSRPRILCELSLDVGVARMLHGQVEVLGLSTGVYHESEVIFGGNVSSHKNAGIAQASNPLECVVNVFETGLPRRVLSENLGGGVVHFEGHWRENQTNHQ